MARKFSLEKTRNIGIMAHISNAGKTDNNRKNFIFYRGNP